MDPFMNLVGLRLINLANQSIIICYYYYHSTIDFIVNVAKVDLLAVFFYNYTQCT